MSESNEIEIPEDDDLFEKVESQQEVQQPEVQKEQVQPQELQKEEKNLRRF